MRGWEPDPFLRGESTKRKTQQGPLKIDGDLTTLLDLSVSSYAHVPANLLCIHNIFKDGPQKESSCDLPLLLINTRHETKPSAEAYTQTLDKAMSGEAVERPSLKFPEQYDAHNQQSRDTRKVGCALVQTSATVLASS